MRDLFVRYALAAGVCAAWPALSQPGSDGPQQPDPAETGVQETEAATPSRVSFALDVLVTNQYFFRGIVQETEGVITQPSATMAVDLGEAGGASYSLFGGIWNSFHDRGTGATDPDDFVSRWYEFDLIAGVSAEAGRWTGSAAYTLYASPNGAFGSVDELAATVGFDDEGLLPVALAPWATIAFEFGENEADGGSGQGIFLGLGVAPSFALLEEGPHPVSIAIPAEIGLSLKDYYERAGSDDFFGYFRIGAEATVGLPMQPGLGEWTASAGVSLLVLGDNTSDINSGDSTEVQVYGGISAAF